MPIVGGNAQLATTTEMKQNTPKRRFLRRVELVPLTTMSNMPDERRADETNSTQVLMPTLVKRREEYIEAQKRGRERPNTA